MHIKHEKSRPRMLRILRIKFIALNMLLGAVVLAVAFGVIIYADYSSRLATVYSELDLVLANLSSLDVPQIAGVQTLTRETETKLVRSSPAGPASPQNSSSERTYADKQLSSSSSEYTVPTIGDSTESSSVILVAVYEVAPNGVYTVILEHTTAAMPPSVILRSNEIVMASDQSRGFLPEYDLYYERTLSQSDPNNFLVAYADGRSVSEWKTLAWTLIFVGIAALGALFLVNIFFSRWALRPVEMSVKQQQQFTADASHELKTPLTVILANMAILRSQLDASVGEQMQWIESTQTEAERMQLLVNDMLALSNPNRENVKYQTSDVDFSDLVEGEVLQFESVAFEQGVSLESSIEEDVLVIGNQERLARMVATLIDNACKYSGGIEGARVDVKLEVIESAGIRRGERDVALSVRNNGPVISEEDLPHVFDRFYRADKARTSDKGGYGLGLAIGQEIAQEHNGAITVESSQEEGTVFTVTLPLAIQ